MKLSHEKIIQLSHRIVSAIEALDEVEFYDDLNTIRQEAVKILTDLLHGEEKIDQLVRQRIATHQRIIPEGGGEWDILYRKYYQDELRKLGVALSSPQH
jgi:hypothetical protein